MILDTNGLSAFAEDDPELLHVLPSDRPWFLPAVVLGEYLFGLEGSRKRDARLVWLEGLLGVISVLEVREITSRHYATIRHQLRLAGRILPTNDLWIAALAVEHDLPVVSRDTHFDAVPGIRRIGW